MANLFYQASREEWAALFRPPFIDILHQNRVLSLPLQIRFKQQSNGHINNNQYQEV
jgi:hypothetical protein